MELLLAVGSFTGLTSEQLSAFKAVNSSSAYICRYPGCTAIVAGFDTFDARATHEKIHAPPLVCPHSGCKYKLAFGNLQSLARHVRNFHESGPTTIPKSIRKSGARPWLPEYRCADGTVRRDPQPQNYSGSQPRFVIPSTQHQGTPDQNPTQQLKPNKQAHETMTNHMVGAASLPTSWHPRPPYEVTSIHAKGREVNEQHPDPITRRKSRDLFGANSLASLSASNSPQSAQFIQPLTEHDRMSIMPQDLDLTIKAQLLKVPEPQFRAIMAQYAQHKNNGQRINGMAPVPGPQTDMTANSAAQLASQSNTQLSASAPAPRLSPESRSLEDMSTTTIPVYPASAVNTSADPVHGERASLPAMLSVARNDHCSSSELETQRVLEDASTTNPSSSPMEADIIAARTQANREMMIRILFEQRRRLSGKPAPC
jgi:hypothetical protein